MTETEKDIYSDKIVERLIEEEKESARAQSRRRMFLSAVSAIAIIASYVSLFSVATDFLPFGSDAFSPLLVALIGLIVATLSVFVRSADREREKLRRAIYHIDDQKMELIREWIAFERLSGELLERVDNSNQLLRLSQRIDRLADFSIIGQIDREIVSAALQSRNEIVHRGESTLSRSEELLVKERLSDLNKELFNKLKEAEFE